MTTIWRHRANNTAKGTAGRVPRGIPLIRSTPRARVAANGELCASASMTSGVALIALTIGELSSLWQRSLGRVCTRALWRRNSCIWRSTETAIGGAPRHRSQPKLLDRARRWCVCQTQPTVDPEGDITANTTTDGCITECKEDRSRRAAHLLDAFCLHVGRGRGRGQGQRQRGERRENDECDEG